MRKFKNIYLLVLVSAVLLSACTEPDEITSAKEAGTILSVEDASGKVLGLPNPDETVTFLDVALDFQIKVPVYQKESEVTSYTIVKRLVQNSGETPVYSDWVNIETVNEMPYSLAYTSIGDFLNGIGVTEAALRIGDVFEFTALINRTDGGVEIPSPSKGILSLTINCLSDLAGTYDLAVTRDDGASSDYPGEVIYEISPGYYKTTSTGLWALGAYTADQSYSFEDICGGITIPDQGLFQGEYSNRVYGEGSVDPATGVITNIYTIEFASGNSVYTAVYTPVSKSTEADYIPEVIYKGDRPEFIEYDKNN